VDFVYCLSIVAFGATLIAFAALCAAVERKS